MQKFTIFSILLSVTVILVLGDIMANGYLKKDAFETAMSTDTAVADGEGENDELVPAPEKSEENSKENVDDADGANNKADLSIPDFSSASILSADSYEEEDEVVVITPSLSEEHLLSAGFADPVLKEAIFNGNVFNFISFSDQIDSYIYQSNFFDGELFIGSVYEIKYTSETGAFQGYLNLRDRAKALTSIGVVNETNSYGDSSFYFNHNTKKKTVHMIMKKGSTIYAFEYAYVNHEKMKNLFWIITH